MLVILYPVAESSSWSTTGVNKSLVEVGFGMRWLITNADMYGDMTGSRMSEVD